MRYNPAKFGLTYFAGRLSITVVGAFLGGLSGQFLSGYLGEGILALISVILTIAITIVLLKIDLSTMAERILKKLGWVKNGKHPEKNVQR